jgi:polysaccharide export outer membrane protein
MARHRVLTASLLGLSFAALGALACASGPKATPALVPASETYRVGVSDVLTIRILPDPEVERTDVLVRPDGNISLDLVGDVQAAGRTAPEIAADIEEKMSEFRQDPSVTVVVQAAPSHAVSVIGEVASEKTFALTREMRVSDAVAEAGGASELAASSRVRLVRGEGEAAQLYVVDLDAIRAGDGSSDVLLQEGDLVVVPAAYTVVTGYALRRLLYPVEALFQVLGAGLFTALGLGR